MKINGNEIRPGYILEHNGRLWRVTKTQHVKPGKGGALMQVEMKDIRDGTKLNESFRAAESVEKARLDQQDYQYLYAEGDLYTFMDTTTYEQITINGSLIGDGVPFLQDGMMVTIESHDESPVGITLPETVVMQITDTEAAVKGQTAASSYKPAILENGVRIMVPPFIETGEKIVVNTVEHTYLERAKA